ncbi:MAG: hypothetical protein WCZ28_06245 [Burkholderiaceae bacterium]
MAELAIGLFAALGSTGAAAGAATAATWATTVTTAAGVTSTVAAGASTALSVLQGVATAGSILSSLAGGLSAYAEAQTNADLARLQGNQEVLASEEAAIRIKRDLVQKTGAARVAFAASGLDISSSQEVERDLAAQAEFETGIEKQNARIRRAQALARAGQLETSGSMSLLAAGGKALASGADFGIDIARRG